VTVTAFATKHAMESYGYRFDTPDRSIVISGDTNPTQAPIDACRGCDVLVHEVLTRDWLSRRPDSHAYAAPFHTTTAQLVELATKAKPRLLVLSHTSLSLRPTVDAERSTPATMLAECRRTRDRSWWAVTWTCIDLSHSSRMSLEGSTASARRAGTADPAIPISAIVRTAPANTAGLPGSA
jgi:ribonuclease BN (tRNA processing enzyme)